jgi:hypothetical protein
MATYKQFRLGDLAPTRVPLLSIVYPTGAGAQAARKAIIEALATAIAVVTSVD